MSKLLTTVLPTVKDRLQTYCATAYSRNGINQMWILKNSKDFVESLSSQSLSVITSVKTFYFSTLYTTIPQPKLKSRLKDLVTNSFRAKSVKRRYSYIVVHGLNAYIVKDHTNSKIKYTEDDIVNMINFLIENIFIEFGGRIFQQTVGIPMGTNCATFLVDLFLLIQSRICPRNSS